MLNQLSKEIHGNNVKKGFYDDKKNIAEILALIHSEVSEALEADRSASYTVADVKAINEIQDPEVFKKLFKEHIKDTFEDEIADAVIRLLDLSGYLKINIEDHVKAKVRYNTQRPYKHGKNY